MRKISEILHDTRIERGLRLEDVERAIKIRKAFLIEIEKGEYQKLPSESYALGFVKNYASFLGINKEKAAALFRREFEGQHKMPTFKSQDKRLRKKILLTPQVAFAFLIVVVIIGYIVFQYSSFLFGPELVVESPKEGLRVEENIVDVSGTTDPYASVLVNNEDVYVKLDGTFKKTLYLFEGNKQITVIAKNRNGKETKKVINVTVE